jgi:rod shape-determining protein MreD
MIMRQGQQLLLPANPLFVWGSMLAALLLDMFLNMGLTGRAAWVPDVLAVVLVFWTVHQSQRVGIGVAFVFGLLVDVHQGALLGQNALAYTVLSFFAIAMHRRLLWFPMSSQSVQVLPLFAAAHLVELSLRMLVGGTFPGWSVLLSPLLEAVLWPIANLVLLAPQRRAPDPDANRPL